MPATTPRQAKGSRVGPEDNVDLAQQKPREKHHKKCQAGTSIQEFAELSELLNRHTKRIPSPCFPPH